jgi:crotonobetainyl-CoA:carnitine CoA-transferase CaiB-like acyl-CoA transferase
LQETWNEALRQKDFDEINEIVTRYGGQAFRANTYESMTAHPQIGWLNALSELTAPDGSTVKSTAFPWTMSETPASIRLQPPRLGQHTDEILNAVGISSQDIPGLRSVGVVK